MGICHHICQHANIIDRYFENILAYTITETPYTDGSKTVFIIFLRIYLLFAVIIQKQDNHIKTYFPLKYSEMQRYKDLYKELVNHNCY